MFPRLGIDFSCSLSRSSMLCSGPAVQVSKELRKRGGLVVSVEAAGVGENPSETAAEGLLLQADTGGLVARDNAVGPNANEGDHSRSPTFNLGFKAFSASAKFVGRKFIGARGGAFDHVGDAELEVQQQGILKGIEEARSKTAAVQGGPEAVAWPAKMPANGGGVETGVDAGKENDEVLGDQIRDKLVRRREDLSFCRLPRDRQFPTLHSPSDSRISCPSFARNRNADQERGHARRF